MPKQEKQAVCVCVALTGLDHYTAASVTAKLVSSHSNQFGVKQGNKAVALPDAQEQLQHRMFSCTCCTGQGSTSGGKADHHNKLPCRAIASWALA